MDQRLRDLHRRFDAEPSDRLAEELMREHARRGEHAPPWVLRRSRRWEPLTSFVARWFKRPLGDTDGCSADELAATERRLGVRLPAALAEWFLLVDRRLQSVQDSPLRLDKVKIDDEGLLPVWWENQGVWSLRVRSDAPEDDPPIEADEEFPISGRLVETLLSMVTSDTLVGAWCGDHRGPLGWLGEHVRGGTVDGAEIEAVAWLRLPLLPGPGNPFFQEPKLRVRGDDTLVVRFTGAGLEWMTATPEAFARLSSVLELH